MSSLAYVNLPPLLTYVAFTRPGAGLTLPVAAGAFTVQMPFASSIVLPSLGNWSVEVDLNLPSLALGTTADYISLEVYQIIGGVEVPFFNVPIALGMRAMVAATPQIRIRMSRIKDFSDYNPMFCKITGSVIAGAAITLGDLNLIFFPIN